MTTERADHEHEFEVTMSNGPVGELGAWHIECRKCGYERHGKGDTIPNEDENPWLLMWTSTDKDSLTE